MLNASEYYNPQNEHSSLIIIAESLLFLLNEIIFNLKSIKRINIKDINLLKVEEISHQRKSVLFIRSTVKVY